MKIVIQRDELLNAINTVKDVATGELPVLQNIKIEATGADEVTLTATNLDQTLVTKAKCEVKDPGATTVPAKLISQMVGALTTPTVEFSKDKNTLSKAVLVGGDVTYKLACIDPSEFPKAAYVNGTEVVFTKAELKEIVRKTLYAASIDGTRKIYMSVCFQTEDGAINAIATDGRRLGCINIKKDVKAGSEVIVPTASIKFLQRLIGGDGDVKMVIDGGKAVKFVTDTWSIQTKIVADMYPNWRQVVPATFANKVIVDRNEFTNAVKQASISSESTDSPMIIVNIKNGAMTFTASSADVSDAKATITAKFDSEGEVKGCFNPKYILDILGSINADTVTINVNDGNKPISIVGDECGNSILMPLRVN